MGSWVTAGTVAPASYSVAYAPPEALSGKPVGTAFDMWSFGVLAYEVVTGVLKLARIGQLVGTAADKAPLLGAGTAWPSNCHSSKRLPITRHAGERLYGHMSHSDIERGLGGPEPFARDKLDVLEPQVRVA